MDLPMKKLLLLCIILHGCARYSEQASSLVAIHLQDRNGIKETISVPERLQNYERVDFLSSQPYKKVLRIYKANQKNRSIITAYHPNGTIAEYLEAQDTRANGYFREWFPNGQLKIEAIVIGGTADITPDAKKDWLFDGTCHVWNEQGNLVAKIPYIKGVIEGMSLSYHPNGAIQRQVPYINSMEEGEMVEFYPTGMIKLRQNHAKGQKNGSSIGYFDNGQTAWIEEYTEGRVLQGRYYTLKGDQIAEVNSGRGIRALYQGNSLSCLVETHQGVPEGFVKQFTPKEELSSTYSLKNGRKHGEEIEYYLPLDLNETQVRPKLSIQWDQDVVHGIVKTWYPTGQLQSQREYCRNEKLGPSCAWYKNGALMLVEEYEEGRLAKGAYYKKSQNEPVSTIVNGNGIASLYDENGIFLKKVTYAKGKPTDPED